MHGFVDSEGNAIDVAFHYMSGDQIAIRDALWNDEGKVIDIDDLPVPISRLALPFDDPNRIPDLSIEDIEDRGKAGVLAKSLLVWQLFVFLASCFARWDQSLSLSLLEITTIGHSLCSIIAMVLWWYKPHSIGEATVIDRKGPIFPPPRTRWGKVFSPDSLSGAINRGATKISADDGMDVPRIVTVVAIAVLYGLPHLLGLSVRFSTFAEHTCWEIATVTFIGSPLVMCGILWILWIAAYAEKLGRAQDVADISLSVLLIVLLVLYPIASMGESVRQIFALPVESFREPQLATYLPSFS